SRYNKLFSSRRLRFLRDVQGCPSAWARHAAVGMSRTVARQPVRAGATLRVFHLQFTDGFGGNVVAAILVDPELASREILVQLVGALWAVFSVLSTTSCGPRWRDMDSCCVRGRSARRRCAGSPTKGKVCEPATDRFDDHYDRAGLGAGAVAVR